jgi:hypothetical protein
MFNACNAFSLEVKFRIPRSSVLEKKLKVKALEVCGCAADITSHTRKLPASKSPRGSLAFNRSLRSTWDASRISGKFSPPKTAHVI